MKALIILIVVLISISYSYGQTADDLFLSGIEKAKVGDFKGAIADYTKGIELRPNSANAHLLRGSFKTELKDYRGAIADFTKSLDLRINKDAYYLRGMAELKIGQKDSGCLDLSRAGELGHLNAYDSIAEYCN